jgi:hypothetical protein
VDVCAKTNTHCGAHVARAVQSYRCVVSSYLNPSLSHQSFLNLQSRAIRPRIRAEYNLASIAEANDFGLRCLRKSALVKADVWMGGGGRAIRGGWLEDFRNLFSSAQTGHMFPSPAIHFHRSPGTRKPQKLVFGFRSHSAHPLRSFMRVNGMWIWDRRMGRNFSAVGSSDDVMTWHLSTASTLSMPSYFCATLL